MHLMPNNAYPHDGPAKRVLSSHFSEEDTKIRDIQVCLVSKAAFFRLRQRMAQGAGRAASGLLDEATCSPDPAQTPPRLRPIEWSRAGPAFQLKAKRDFVIGRGGRKAWVGLPSRREAARGRDFDGAWPLAPPPSAGSKRTAAAGAGSEHGWPIPARLLGASHRAAPRRGRAGTGDRAGHLGLGQAEGKSLLGTTEGTGVGASAALPLAILGPCPRPRPRPRLPAAKPAAAGPIGACAASCARDSANAWGPGGGREKLSHVGMLLGLYGRHHPSWAPE